MKAKFYAFDRDGKQIKNLSPSDFKLTENGTERKVTSVSCPPDKAPERISSTIVIDVSGSMTGTPLEIAKTVAKTWVNALPLGQSNCAVTSFDDGNYFNQDFTTNRNKLISAIDAVVHGGGTDYNKALIEAVAGGILVAKTAKDKKVIIFITDGQPNQEPDETRIINEARANGITIYCITIGLPAHQSMKHFSEQTGGLWFENVSNEEQAKKIAEMILNMSLFNTPCEISWLSGPACSSIITNYKSQITNLGLESIGTYQNPKSSIAKLEFKPSSLKFINPVPNVKKDSKIKIYAGNADFNITNISSSNPAFDINTKVFILKSGDSTELTVSYFPLDSGYNYCKFTFENVNCSVSYLVSGGWKGKKPSQRTIKLIQPNGGEVFPVGMDTVITWEGVLPDEKVKIEYSSDNGTSWILVADSSTNLTYNWLVPNTPSNQCIARVTAKTLELQSDCTNDDVRICNQVWMGCNLDVDTYRNGDPIPGVTDPKVWDTLKTGAWCYYDNDPANGAKYGKLYNWYAVNDPRGLAPVGWHVPTNTEWTELENCLIANEYNYDGTTTGNKIGKALASESGWNSSNFYGAVGSTDFPLKRNASDFSGLPGGYRVGNGVFEDVGRSCNWWSASDYNTTSAWLRYLYYNLSSNNILTNYKDYGYSVRCVKDK